VTVIFVGNLCYEATEMDLRELFSNYSKVSRVNVPQDREKRRGKGFAFVEMPDRDAALRAIEQLNGVPVLGRAIRVEEAQPKESQKAAG
jgi:RNA recognition motif-containing protein